MNSENEKMVPAAESPTPAAAAENNSPTVAAESSSPAVAAVTDSPVVAAVSNSPAAADETGVTMLDVLQEEEDLEEESNAVLGAADDKNCTYDQGYMKRQAVYACNTCSVPRSPDFVPAGMCLACSYHCHGSHELVELYTKRNFKCDCGTSRLEGVCTLRPGKSDNTNNSYNQNYRGVYCTCSRPYPDPDDTTPDEMIQCVLCEDWYHGRHLGLRLGPPADKDYAEMICNNCVQRYPILEKYSYLDISKAKDRGEEADVDVESTKDAENLDTATDPSKAAVCPKDVESTKDAEYLESSKDIKDAESNKDVSGVSVLTNESCEPQVECKLERMTASSLKTTAVGTLFLPDSWRAQLCRCPSCTQQYSVLKISFLLDSTDTVHYYESQAGEHKGQFEKGMEELSKMDRIKQIEAISSYNSMKTELMDYLATFARENKVVKEADIQKFFQGMSSSKRRRLQ